MKETEKDNSNLQTQANLMRDRLKQKLEEIMNLTQEIDLHKQKWQHFTADYQSMSNENKSLMEEIVNLREMRSIFIE